MVILLTGASHTGKTLLAQRLLEELKIPYLSLDHLKMGLIRAGKTDLTPEDDEALTATLWPIVREMAKTAIENGQNLTVEGLYIPQSWQEDFPPEYLKEIRFLCLVMTEGYIRGHFSDILKNASVIERRGAETDFTVEGVLRENAAFLSGCRARGYPVHMIDEAYDVEEAWRRFV